MTTRSKRPHAQLAALALAATALSACYEPMRQLHQPNGMVTIEHGRCRELPAPAEPGLICTDTRRLDPAKTGLAVVGIVLGGLVIAAAVGLASSLASGGFVVAIGG
jgi:hypothetical protein